jgi:hypothetical protein
MDRTPSQDPAKTLEDAFFAREHAKLLEQIRDKAERVQRRDALRQVLGGADDAILDRLLDSGVRPETALALTLFPLARVAWADGGMDARERDAILKAAGDRGIEPGTPARELLEGWLAAPPGDHVAAAWTTYVESVWPQLPAEERRELRTRVLDLARGVAEAAGGFLGLGSKVSAAERAALDDVERRLSV